MSASLMLMFWKSIRSTFSRLPVDPEVQEKLANGMFRKCQSPEWAEGAAAINVVLLVEVLLLPAPSTTSEPQ